MNVIFSLVLGFLVLAVSARDELNKITFHNGLARVPIKERISRDFLVSEKLPTNPESYIYANSVNDAIILEERAQDTSDGPSLNISYAYNNTFSFGVTFDSLSLTTFGIPNNTDITMEILLSTGDIALSLNCDNFQAVTEPCFNGHCDVNSTNGVLRYPFFNSTDIQNSLYVPTITIADFDWTETAGHLWLAYTCHYTPGYFTDSQSYGWLGLGPYFTNETEGFTKDRLFSILINTTTGEGELIFGVNSSYTNSSSSITIPAPKWMFEYNSFAFGTLLNSYSQNAPSLIFDLLYQRVALPADQYNNVMLYLLNYTDQGMNCSYTVSDSAFSDCYFTGNISVLPNIVYNNSKPAASFTISPFMYLEDLDNSTYKTMFDSFDTQYCGLNYTVLGSKVLSKFYSVFNSSSDSSITATITLYPLNSTSPNPNPNPPGPNPNPNPDPPNYTLIIVLSAVGFCALVVIGYVLYRIKSAKNKRTRPEMCAGDYTNKFDTSDAHLRPYSG